jgi:hypothetical protein
MHILSRILFLSLIHLAQEGKVLSPLDVHPIFFSEIKVYIYIVMMTGASRSQTSELYIGVKHSHTAGDQDAHALFYLFNS